MNCASYASLVTSAATPQVRIRMACERLGQEQFVRRCLDLLAGRADDTELLITLGGPHAQQLIASGIPEGQEYWVRVWAARGLLWAGAGDDMAELRVALGDASWRVREMTCKVVARHRLGDLLDHVAALEHSDPVPRVRAAAARAARRVLEAES